jgi:hypothetical protein
VSAGSKEADGADDAGAAAGAMGGDADDKARVDEGVEGAAAAGGGAGAEAGAESEAGAEANDAGDDDKRSMFVQAPLPDDPLLKACVDMGMQWYSDPADIPVHLDKRVRKSMFPPTEEEREWMHLGTVITIESMKAKEAKKSLKRIQLGIGISELTAK